MRDGVSAGCFGGAGGFWKTRACATLPGMPLAPAWRLFAALYPPPESAAALLAALETVGAAGANGLRFVPPEQVHLTLQFIGDTPERDLPHTLESVERSCGGIDAFALTPLRLVTFPLVEGDRRTREPPRLIAAITDAPPGLLELQRRLAHRLARNARERAGDRFTPHLTLARFAQGSRSERIDAPLSGPAALAFPVRRIRLMRSALHPTGATHVEVASFDLGADSRSAAAAPAVG